MTENTNAAALGGEEAGMRGPAPHFESAMPIELLRESLKNPRKRFRAESMRELEESVRAKGVVTPLLVRPAPARAGDFYEIAAGHRRFRAATAAGRPTVPVLIREMGDEEFLELLVMENDQREDVHAFEEASGYQALLALPGYDVAKIAARVGRSVKYVYDRLKLLQLTPAAQKLFLEDRFTAAHAILLARLTPAEQAEALNTGALFAPEGGNLFDDDPDADDKIDSDPYYGMKPRSVREFEHWINRNVRANRHEIDPVLFPETAALVSEAQAAGEKIIPIMRLTQRPEAARTGDKILSEAMWRRADGEQGSKTCELSEPGVIEIGPDRYEAFRICRKRDRCSVHWAREIKDRQARQKAAEKATASGKDPRKAERDTYAEQERRREEQQAQEDARRARWKKATPAILEALADAVNKAPTKADGPLARILLLSIRLEYNTRSVVTAAAKRVPIGKTADDALRRAAFLLLASEAASDWRGPEEFPKTAKVFGIDLGKILNQAAPIEKPKPEVQTSAKPGEAEAGTCRECGCTEEKACAGGCTWADRTKTICSECTPNRKRQKKATATVKRAGKKKARR